MSRVWGDRIEPFPQNTLTHTRGGTTRHSPSGPCGFRQRVPFRGKAHRKAEAEAEIEEEKEKDFLEVPSGRGEGQPPLFRRR